MSDDVIPENVKINVESFKNEIDKMVFLNQPTVPLTRLDIKDHGIYYFQYKTLLSWNYKYFKLFVLVINKASLINMQTLTEENDFGLAFPEQPSITKQGKHE